LHVARRDQPTGLPLGRADWNTRGVGEFESFAKAAVYENCRKREWEEGVPTRSRVHY